MSAQSEALRLANSLAAHSLSRYGQTQAAAELRRLSAVEAQRDALLEALKALLSDYDSAIDPGESKLIDKARAAIKAVEEGK